MNGALGRLKEQDSVDELYKNERATVSLGYIGLYEVATTFFGPIWENNPEAKAFTIEIVKRMHEDCEEWSKATGYHFSVYSTPSESLTDRFCRMDKEKFGSIPDITEKDYYTNSFHYDIRKNPTPFEKLDFEKDYPVYANGGFIHYCEYPMIQQNPKALEAVWIMPMTELVIWERMRQLIIVMPVVLKVILHLLRKDLSAPNVAMQILKLVMSLNVLVDILGTLKPVPWFMVATAKFHIV